MAARILSDEESWEVLEPHWKIVVDKFCKKGLISRDALPRIIIDSSYHDTCRHFAECMRDGSEVHFAPEMVHLPQEATRAIMAHELGHAVDLSSPGKFWYRHGELAMASAMPNKGLRKLLRRWDERSDDEVERVADALAELAMGERIGYVGSDSCLIEYLGKGKPRPKGLR